MLINQFYYFYFRKTKELNYQCCGGVLYEKIGGGLAKGLRGGIKTQIGNSFLVNLAISYDQITLEESGGVVIEMEKTFLAFLPA